MPKHPKKKNPKSRNHPSTGAKIGGAGTSKGTPGVQQARHTVIKQQVTKAARQVSKFGR